MSDYALVATRADGQLQSVAIKDPSLDGVCRQALRFAQNAAVHGCPLGDAMPPKWIDVQRGDGELVIRIRIDDSLKPLSGWHR